MWRIPILLKHTNIKINLREILYKEKNMTKKYYTKKKNMTKNTNIKINSFKKCKTKNIHGLLRVG